MDQADNPSSQTVVDLMDPRFHSYTSFTRPSTMQNGNANHPLMGRTSYRWSFCADKPKGSDLNVADIQGSRSTTAWFKPDVPGAYVLNLSVKGHGATYSDAIKVRVIDLDKKEDLHLLDAENLDEEYYNIGSRFQPPGSRTGNVKSAKASPSNKSAARESSISSKGTTHPLPPVVKGKKSQKAQRDSSGPRKKIPSSKLTSRVAAKGGVRKFKSKKPLSRSLKPTDFDDDNDDGDSGDDDDDEQIGGGGGYEDDDDDDLSGDDDEDLGDAGGDQNDDHEEQGDEDDDDAMGGDDDDDDEGDDDDGGQGGQGDEQDDDDDDDDDGDDNDEIEIEEEEDDNSEGEGGEEGAGQRGTPADDEQEVDDGQGEEGGMFNDEDDGEDGEDDDMGPPLPDPPGEDNDDDMMEGEDFDEPPDDIIPEDEDDEDEEEDAADVGKGTAEDDEDDEDDDEDDDDVEQ